MTMTQEAKEKLLLELEERLFLGCTLPSEWTTVIMQDAEGAFVSGHYLAAILTAQAAMECNLRHENGVAERCGFFELIEGSDLPAELKQDLHVVRRYRNRWVHVADPSEDSHLQDHLFEEGEDMERMAVLAITCMLKVHFSFQGL